MHVAFDLNVVEPAIRLGGLLKLSPPLSLPLCPSLLHSIKINTKKPQTQENTTEKFILTKLMLTLQ